MINLLLILAVFYATVVITEFDGPFYIFPKARRKLQFLDCFVCTSFWVAGAITIINGNAGLYTLAYAGVAILIWKNLWDL